MDQINLTSAPAITQQDRLTKAEQYLAKNCIKRNIAVRLCYIMLACFLIVLAAIGMVVPLVPRTPFILAAAWAAARGYPPLYYWLVRNRFFGTIIMDWQAGGVISRKTKWIAVISMLVSAVIILIFVKSVWVQLIGIGSMVIVATWIWSRPESK